MAVHTLQTADNRTLPCHGLRMCGLRDHPGVLEPSCHLHQRQYVAAAVDGNSTGAWDRRSQLPRRWTAIHRLPSATHPRPHLHPHTPSHTHSHSLSHTLSLSLSLTHPLTLSHTLSHSRTHSLTHTLSHSHTLTLPLTLTLSHTHTHTLSHFLAHTLAHTLTLLHILS